jgi:hypothetical protein
MPPASPGSWEGKRRGCARRPGQAGRGGGAAASGSVGPLGAERSSGTEDTIHDLQTVIAGLYILSCCKEVDRNKVLAHLDNPVGDRVLGGLPEVTLNFVLPEMKRHRGFLQGNPRPVGVIGVFDTATCRVELDAFDAEHPAVPCSL